ncbi:hypothetical protein COOONC_28690 [Cooperia oncophora]
MEFRPSTSSGNFREEILSRLEARNACVRPWAAIFKNYSLMSDELTRVRKRFDNRGSQDIADVPSHSSSLELKHLREELAEVYKQKSRNDQSLIEANRRLDQHDAALNAVTKECLFEIRPSIIAGFPDNPGPRLCFAEVPDVHHLGILIGSNSNPCAWSWLDKWA